MKELVKFTSNLEAVIDGNEIAKPSPSVPVNEIIIKPECIEETEEVMVIMKQQKSCFCSSPLQYRSQSRSEVTILLLLPS